MQGKTRNLFMRLRIRVDLFGLQQFEEIPHLLFGFVRFVVAQMILGSHRVLSRLFQKGLGTPRSSLVLERCDLKFRDLLMRLSEFDLEFEQSL